MKSNQNEYSLFGINGQRKYMNKEERQRFLNCARRVEECKRLFLYMLYYTGARISEVLNLQKHQIDFQDSIVVFESLKKRKRGVFRSVPIPKGFLTDLQFYSHSVSTNRLWNYSRSTGFRYIKRIMQEANISGLQACAKGLRHSFAICAIENGVPLNLIKKWLGHSSIATTAIYLNVTGQEERSFVEKMWV